MSDLTPQELETVDWVLSAKPGTTREEAVQAILDMRTELWNELSREDFSTTEWDYGYGGESYEHAATDHDALYKWIVEREKRLLGGLTLEELVRARDARFPNPEEKP